MTATTYRTVKYCDAVLQVIALVAGFAYANLVGIFIFVGVVQLVSWTVWFAATPDETFAGSRGLYGKSLLAVLAVGLLCSVFASSTGGDFVLFALFAVFPVTGIMALCYFGITVTEAGRVRPVDLYKNSSSDSQA